MGKLRVCEILGVEVEQLFVYDGDAYKIGENEALWRYDSEGKYWETVHYMDELMVIINHPEQITVPFIWTAKDKDDARAVQRLFNDFGKGGKRAIGVKRVGGFPYIKIQRTRADVECAEFVEIAREAFPSVKEGESVNIDTILHGYVM